MKRPAKSVMFDYQPPAVTTVITYAALRKTLREVQEMLLSRAINGGPKHLDMQCITDNTNKCGMAACIGGWTSLFLLGFEGKSDYETDIVSDLFDTLCDLDNEHGYGTLSDLFHRFAYTNDYNEPNVAATAIGRYLRGHEQPWPDGDMPRVLAYTKPAKRK